MIDCEYKYLNVKNKFITDFYNGDVGRNIPTELEEDFDIALLLIENYPLELENLVPEFKENYEICYTAVEKNGNALEYVSPDLQSDMSLIKIAVWSNIEALYFVPEELKHSDELLLHLEDFLDQKDFKDIFPDIYNEVLNRKNNKEHAEKLNALLVEKDRGTNLRHKI